jgi:lysophospholipid acyltransferase 7
MGYLFFLRNIDWFGLLPMGGHANMIQMIMTLKIIGFTFERNTVVTKTRDAKKKSEQIELSSYEKSLTENTITEMVHYCFNYIGLLTGPYFTYRTFHDFFNLPFSKYADSWKSTFERLKYVPAYVALFLIASYIWPLEYASTDEFYESRSFLYRLFFVWPTFFIFRMRIYSGIILAECVCISAGLGAYPKDLNAKCGHGPSVEITKEVLDKADQLEYEFTTVESVDVYGVESCLTFREAMKHWNKCIQYWLAIYVYKRFPNKKYRVIATMLVSAYWHGVHPGYYFCILGPIIYLPVEDIYVKLFKSDNPQVQQVFNVLMWILKFFAFSYLGTAFLLMDVKKIWFYYGSVYHFAYFFWGALYVICQFLWKQKKSALRSAEKHKEAAVAAVVEDKKEN